MLNRNGRSRQSLSQQLGLRSQNTAQGFQAGAGNGNGNGAANNQFSDQGNFNPALANDQGIYTPEILTECAPPAPAYQIRTGQLKCASDCYFDATYRADVDSTLYFGAMQGLPLVAPNFGITDSFVDAENARVDGVVAPVSRYVAFSSILRVEPKIACEILVQTTNNNVFGRSVSLINFDSNLDLCRKGVPFPLCDYCPSPNFQGQNQLFTRVIACPVPLTPTEGVGIFIPAMTDVRVRLGICAIANTRLYTDCNDNRLYTY